MKKVVPPSGKVAKESHHIYDKKYKYLIFPTLWVPFEEKITILMGTKVNEL